MNEQELKQLIKQSVKEPSLSFTDNLMEQISVQQEIAAIQARKVKFLIIACSVLLVLSLFIHLPSISFMHFSLGNSPILLPVVTLLFLVYEIQQLRDIQGKILSLGEKK